MTCSSPSSAFTSSAKLRLVVDDEEATRLGDSSMPDSGGKVTTTSVPSPRLRLESSVPPCSSTTRRLMPRPEAGAALLGGEERLAEARHHVGRHAGAAVAHAHRPAAPSASVSTMTSTSPLGRRGLRGVAHQVDDHLRDLAAVEPPERPRVYSDVDPARLDVARRSARCRAPLRPRRPTSAGSRWIAARRPPRAKSLISSTMRRQPPLRGDDHLGELGDLGIDSTRSRIASA